jgi:hypothetical protein
VLLYCDQSLLELLQANNVDFTHVVSGIDHALLRNLDSKSNADKYPLLVAASPFAMRGFDYRAPKRGITLIVAKSFTN